MVAVKVIQKFAKTLDENDFGLTADVAGSAVDFVKIAEFDVEPQTVMTFGAGGIVNGVDKRGRLYIKMIDAADGVTELTGKVRLVLADANEVNITKVLEDRSALMSASQTDRNVGYLLGEFPRAVRENSKLQIWFKCDTPSKSIDTNSVFQIPTTVGVLGV